MEKFGLSRLAHNQEVTGSNPVAATMDTNNEIRKGWECPKCGTVNSPDVLSCLCASKAEIRKPDTYPIPIPIPWYSWYYPSIYQPYHSRVLRA